MSIDWYRIESGENITCYVVPESSAYEASNIAHEALKIAGIDPDEWEWDFDEFMYDFVEAKLLKEIEEAIDGAVARVWEMARNGEFVNEWEEE